MSNCFTELATTPVHFQAWPRAQTLRTSSFYRRSGEDIGRASASQFLHYLVDPSSVLTDFVMVSQGWVDDGVLYYTTTHWRPDPLFPALEEFVVHGNFDPKPRPGEDPAQPVNWGFETHFYRPGVGWEPQRVENPQGPTNFWSVYWQWHTRFEAQQLGTHWAPTAQQRPVLPTWVKTTYPSDGPPGVPWPPNLESNWWGD